MVIDGKTIRGLDDKAGGKSAFHVVSAYVSGNRFCLGKRAVDEKSNEIPALLDTLSLEGCIVTLDAMGCQKTIAGAIIEKKADYVLTVKDN